MQEHSQDSRSPKTNIILLCAALFLVFYGLKWAAAIIVPFLLSLFIAIIGSGPLDYLKKKRIPMAVSMLIITVAFIGITISVISFVGVALSDFSQNLPQFQERIQEKTNGLVVWLGKKGIEMPSKKLVNTFDPKAVMQLVNEIFVGIKSLLSNAFLIIMFTIFILLEMSVYRSKMDVSFGNSRKILENFDQFVGKIKHYLTIKTYISFATGVFIAAWLALFGLKYYLLWGLLAFLLNFIPNIGSIIAAVPATLLSLVEQGIGKALLVMAGYLVVNIVLGSIIEPRIMGRGLGISTLMIFVSVILWGWILGPVGMLLAVPITLCLKVIFQSNPNTRWIAILLDSEVGTESA